MDNEAKQGPQIAPQPESAVDGMTSADIRIMKPTCPGCGADPLVIKRLRYDFADGVVVEVIFCHNPDCRIAITAMIVGIERPRTANR